MNDGTAANVLLTHLLECVLGDPRLPFTAAATRGDTTLPLGGYKLLYISMEHEPNWA